MANASAQSLSTDSAARSMRTAVIGALVLAVAAVIAVFVFAPRKSVENFGAVPDFKFESIDGGGLSRADLLGNVWVGNFIFTSCKGICPVISGKMGEIEQSFLTEPGFRLVSFSIDPARDTVAALSAYRAKWAKRPAAWLYARPTRAELETFASGMKLVVGEVGDFAHTTRVVLVDKLGNIRGYYHGTDDEQLQKLRSDARSILSE